MQPQEHQHSAAKRDAGPTAATRSVKKAPGARISASGAVGRCLTECGDETGLKRHPARALVIAIPQGNA